MITLGQLLQDTPSTLTKQQANITCSGIGLDSNHIGQNEVFVALAGNTYHGWDYLPGAINNGVKVVLVLVKSLDEPLPDCPEIAVVGVELLPDKLAQLAQKFYTPTQTLIAVTGTNGKSSIVAFIVQLLHYLSIDGASIGSLGVQTMSQNKLISLPSCLFAQTTPNVLLNHKILAILHNKTHIALEASSHALAQNRLLGLNINTAIFTNLSQDHLDYHHTMADYFAAKQQLFQRPELQTAIINTDDQQAKTLLASTTARQTFTYGLKTDNAKTSQANNHLNPDDYTADQTGFFGKIARQPFRLNLLGKFNLLNILASITYLHCLGFKLKDIVPHLSKITAPLGRMQPVKNRPIWIDFAHTPHALEQAMQALKTHYPNHKIVVVFGCGGNKDQGKRIQMGRIADQLSTRIILTDDNPRDENPANIIADIREGITQTNKVHIIDSRQQAIKHAIDTLGDDECLLIAGKGAENFQLKNQVKTLFNDYNIACGYVC